MPAARPCRRRMEESDDDGKRWSIDVAGLGGYLCHVELRGWGATVQSLHHAIKGKLGIRKREQRLLVGIAPCRPFELLKDLDVPLAGGVVTMIRGRRHLRCFSCGARGLFGMLPKLKSCARCMDTYYCDSSCQRKDWPRHRLHCAAACEKPRSLVRADG